VYERDSSLHSATIWFWVDKLPALGQHAYTLYGSASPKCRAARFPASPITWTSLDGETVEVSNGLFSLRLAGTAEFAEPKKATEVGGPLRGFKGVDGIWRGQGSCRLSRR